MPASCPKILDFRKFFSENFFLKTLGPTAMQLIRHLLELASRIFANFFFTEIKATADECDFTQKFVKKIRTFGFPRSRYAAPSCADELHTSEPEVARVVEKFYPDVHINF